MPETDSPTSGGGIPPALKQKVGPLPVYGWGIILVGGIVGFYVLRKKRGSTSLPPSTIGFTGGPTNGGLGAGGGGSSGGGNGSPPTTTPPPGNPPLPVTPPISAPFGPSSPGYPRDPSPPFPTTQPTPPVTPPTYKPAAPSVPTPTTAPVFQPPAPIVPRPSAPTEITDGLGHIWDSINNRWRDQWGNYQLPDGSWSNSPHNPVAPAPTGAPVPVGQPGTPSAPTPEQLQFDTQGHAWSSRFQTWVDRWGNRLLPSGKWSNE